MYRHMNNPMLKGYVSNQERDQMRERDRQSRSQKALKANRDPFLEHTSGALFAEPVKVRSNDQQITEILGDYERVAPMCSGRAQTSLVGAYAMPCTPAPAYHDHDHLFTAPQPPPPPPQTSSRPPASASLRPHSSVSSSAFSAAASSSSSMRHGSRSAGAFSTTPADPSAAAGSVVDGHRFQRPTSVDKAPARAGSVSRSGSSSGSSRSVGSYGSSAPLEPERFPAPPRVETILQEMRMPLPGMVTPLKVGHEPFAFPFSKEGLITPLHCPSNSESLHADSLSHHPRQSFEQPESFDPPAWPNGGGSILSPIDSSSRSRNQDPLPLAKMPVPNELSLSADLSLSEDSDDGEVPASQPPPPSSKQPQVTAAPATPIQSKVNGTSAPPAASSASESESESEDDDDDDDEESESESGDQSDNSVDTARRTSRKAHKPPSSRRTGSAGAPSASGTVSASSTAPAASPSFSVGGGHQSSGSGGRTHSGSAANSGSLSAQDVSDSPSGATSSGSKWSLMWIINNKDPSGTPASNLFGDTPARSNEKRSPLGLPGSTDDTGSGCFEPAAPQDRQSHTSPDNPPSPRQEIPTSDRHSHRRRTPANAHQKQQQSQKQKQKRQQKQQQQQQLSSSSAPIAQRVYSGSDAAVGSAGGEGSTPPVGGGGGGKRPRPRLSALDQAVSASAVQDAVSCSSSSSLSTSSAASSAEEEVEGGRERQKASRPAGRRAVPTERRRRHSPSASCSSSDEAAGRCSPTRSRRRHVKPHLSPRGLSVAEPAAETGFLSDSSEGEQDHPTPAATSSQQRRSPAVSNRYSASSSPALSSDDSPPKLDADGVASGDANKRATFNRLFLHRVSGAKRSQTATPSTVPAGGKAGEPAPRGHERLSPGTEPVDASQSQHLLHAQLLAPPPPLPPLQRVRGVPILRCRIEKSILCQKQRSSPGSSGKPTKTRSPCPLPSPAPSSPHRGLMPAPSEPPEPRQTDESVSSQAGRSAEPTSPTGSIDVAPSKKRRRKRDSQREHKRSRHSALSPAVQCSVSVSSSSSTAAGDSLTSSSGHQQQLQVTTDKHRSADSCSGSRPSSVLASVASERTSDTAPASTGSSLVPPSSGAPRRQLRIESPSTGVREADSSTNPGCAVSYDSSIPAALYTNQPFPIPATSWSDARSSYLDPCLDDSVERDQNQYLKQARRLKRAADIENDLTVKVIRYTQAVLYFLLTALSMETNSTDLDAVVTMLNDTLKLIKDMVRFTTATYHKQGIRPSQIDHKLQCLLLRCQGLIYLRLYKLKEGHHKQVQRQIADFRLQLVGECASSESSGSSTCTVPTGVVRLLLDCHQTQQNLQCWLEFWEQADELIQRAQDTAEFFSDIDRTMGGLSATSTLLDLVYYIRETTRRLQDMHCRQLAIGD